MASPLHAAAHLAVWAGLYVAGAVVCFAQISGIDAQVAPAVRLRAAAFAFCTAMAVYLLDRVKLANAWLDPADAQAHPDRFQFLARHARGVRATIALLLAAATWLGSGLAPWVIPLPLLACAGVLLYAARPRTGRARPKDIILLKNGYVAAGITGFAAIVALAAAGGDAGGSMSAIVTTHAAPLTLSCIHLAARVWADAALCDLDDEQSDRDHGTHTLPTRFGRRRAWDIALAVRLGLAAALALTPILHLDARLAWAGVTVISSLALRLAAPARVRDWVDARLPMEAAVVTLILSA